VVESLLLPPSPPPGSRARRLDFGQQLTPNRQRTSLEQLEPRPATVFDPKRGLHATHLAREPRPPNAAGNGHGESRRPTIVRIPAPLGPSLPRLHNPRSTAPKVK
jgi:hypothetical protein